MQSEWMSIITGRLLMSLSHYSKYKTYSNMKQGEELTFQYWKSVLLFKKTIMKTIK